MKRIKFMFLVIVSLLLIGCGHKHNYNEKIIEPTCTEEGYTEYTCECGDTYKDNYITALGHEEVIQESKVGTCTEIGISQGKKCSRCGEVMEAQKETEYGDCQYVDGECKNCGSSIGIKYVESGNYSKISEIDKTLEIIKIASMYHGKPVEEIPGNVFSGALNLHTVYLPNTIKKMLGNNFSNCKNLKNIYYQGTIDDWMKMEIVDFNDDLEQLNVYLLNENNEFYIPTEITITSNIKELGYHALDCFTSLEKVTIEQGVEIIGPITFNDCLKLKEIIIPDSVTMIYNNAFEKCISLEKIAIPGSVKTLQNNLFLQNH